MPDCSKDGLLPLLLMLFKILKPLLRTEKLQLQLVQELLLEIK